MNVYFSFNIDFFQLLHLLVFDNKSRTEIELINNLFIDFYGQNSKKSDYLWLAEYYRRAALILMIYHAEKLHQIVY